MDASRFSEARTGELVRVSTVEGHDWAFIPNPLPPDWEFPVRLWPLLADARDQLARLDEKGRTVANPSLLLHPLQKREALRSSSLEGTFATAKELLLFELKPREATSKEDPANAWREVYNFGASLRYGFNQLHADSDGLPLCNRLIQNMHKYLMQGSRGKAPGQFRSFQVHVGSDRRYVPPPPGEPLKKCMGDLESYLHDHGTRYDPIVLSYLVHYQFEAIHPFLDGNGRVGRSLLSVTIFQWKELFMPWLYMSAYFERYKDEYVDNMFRVSTHGDWERWIEFCLRGTAAQCRDAIDRCNKLNGLRKSMQNELDHLPRMHKFIDGVFQNPIFTATHVADWCGVSKPTARSTIERLIELGIVRYLTGERPKTFFVPQIFTAAYSEDSDDNDINA